MFVDALTLLFKVLLHLLSSTFFHPLVQHTLRAVLFVLGGGATYVLWCLWPAIKRAHPPSPPVYGRPFARRDPSPRSSASDTKIGGDESHYSASNLDLDHDLDDDAASTYESFAPERYGFSLMDRSLIGLVLCCTHACLFSKYIIIRSVELSLSILRQQHRSFVVARAACRAAAAKQAQIALELEESRPAQERADSLPPPPEPAPLWWATTTKPALPIVEPVFWEVTMRSGRVHRTYDHPSCSLRNWTLVYQPYHKINWEPIKPPAVYYYPTTTPTPSYFFQSPPSAPTAAFGTTEYLQQVGYLGKATRTKDGKMFDAKTSHAASSKTAAGAKVATAASGSGMKKNLRKPLGATYLC
ncbi:hypothetical protein RQP46_010752 [Phenoliferia psychrophenolica]